MTSEVSSTNNLTLAVLKTLSYYRIFQHPLKAMEVYKGLARDEASLEEVEQTLRELVQAGVIDCVEGHYFIDGDPERVNIRKKGEIRAKKLMKVARRMGGLIYLFPFIRAVFVSGSLSKGSVPEDADIDYFLITKKNRLWIARTSLVIFKRLFLLNSKKYFCVNYFVDEETMEIPDHNIFTATEVSTLIPIRGQGYYSKFIRANSWANDFFPNQKMIEPALKSETTVKKVSRKLIEPMFFNALAEKLDKYFMRKTYKRWMDMYGGGYTEEEFELAFRSRRGTSKNHDKNYQKRVLTAIDENMERALIRMKTEMADA